MSITKCPGHMRSLKLNFSATVLTLGLKAKIFENLRLCQAKFCGELRTRATFDRCVAWDSQSLHCDQPAPRQYNAPMADNPRNPAMSPQVVFQAPVTLS